MGLHNGHNPNAEQSIKDFVNRESISDLDDINSESINTISMISDDMPILLVFIDLDLWKKDKEAAEQQRDIIENGCVEMFSQTDKAEPYERERPVARLYNTMNKNYQSIIKQLSDLLPKELPKQEDDGFGEFCDSR
jgi:hypothetical protein